MFHAMTRGIALGAMTVLLVGGGAPQRGAVTVDGQYDSSYGGPSVVQNTQTDFGNNDDPDPGTANGSELDQGDALIAGGYLYIFLGGNLESNYNKLEVFIDARDGGQNSLRGDNSDVDFNALGAMGDDGSGNGLTFDAGIEADMWVGVTCGIDEATSEFIFHVSYAELRTEGGGFGSYLGSGGTGETLIASNGMQIALDNTNIGGVEWGTGIDCGEGVTTGVELAIPLFLFDWDSTNPAIDSASVCSFINSGGHDYMSNQVLGGIGGGANLGNPREVDFNTINGDQFFSDGQVADPCPDVTGACCIDETCELQTAQGCADAAGEYLGDNIPCDMNTCVEVCASDITGDGVVDVSDLLQVIAEWNCGL